jgi:osmotically-inducible protein OsmY
MSRQNFYQKTEGDPARLRREEEFDRKKWDREHWERSMENSLPDTLHRNESYESLGGTPYSGGVFSTGSYGGGAEYYSVTGMYENPLLDKNRETHRGKGPKGYERSDARIHEEICERLTHHPLIDASLMDVTVKDREVTLTGEVYDRRMKHMAEDVVDEVWGVREIHNNLRVRNKAA